MQWRKYLLRMFEKKKKRMFYLQEGIGHSCHILIFDMPIVNNYFAEIDMCLCHFPI